MRGSRLFVLAIGIFLLSVFMFLPIEVKAVGLPQSSGSAAQSGATQSQANPQKPQAVAPPPENKSGYRDPDWGPKRQLKKKAVPAVFTGPFQTGQVFVSDGSGDVDILQPDGTTIGTLTTGQTLSAGMAFDRSGNLYVSTFGLPTGVVEFDVNGHLVGPFGAFPAVDVATAFPESVLVTPSGNIFVGAATGEFACSDGTPTPTPVPAFEFSPSGALLNTFNVLSECRGTDWVELLGDQKTLLYTSEGLSVKSFNVSTGTQNPDFASNLPGASAFAFRQLPDGTVLVADSSEAMRLSATGAVLSTYAPSLQVNTLFALNLDPDGTSFWTADLQTGNVFRFDIATGTQLVTFVSPTGFASGLAIFGEKTAGNNNLTITVAGSGTGQVTSSPAGISCPAVCVAQFPDNSSATITATPTAGSTLASFSTNCVPSSPQTTPPTCSVPIVTSDVTVTATFNATTGVIVTVPSGGSTTATTTPGGTAFFGLQISGGPGVTGTVQLTCASSSPLITCTVIPSTVILNGGTTEVAFGIQTFCQGSTLPTGALPGGFGGGMAMLLAAMMFGGIGWTFKRDRRVGLTFAMLMLIMVSGACGGLPKGANGATPAGTYFISLSTTLNGQTQTLPNFLTLVVK
jgi:sugar lactone lactonase YvrE